MKNFPKIHLIKKGEQKKGEQSERQKTPFIKPPLPRNSLSHLNQPFAPYPKRVVMCPSS